MAVKTIRAQCQDHAVKGQYLFYSYTVHGGGNVSRHASALPRHANLSAAPVLVGWCGGTNNNSTYAEGICKVVRVPGEFLVEVVTVSDSEEIRRALEELASAASRPFDADEIRSLVDSVPVA